MALGIAFSNNLKSFLRERKKIWPIKCVTYSLNVPTPIESGKRLKRSSFNENLSFCIRNWKRNCVWGKCFVSERCKYTGDYKISPIKEKNVDPIKLLPVKEAVHTVKPIVGMSPLHILAAEVHFSKSFRPISPFPEILNSVSWFLGIIQWFNLKWFVSLGKWMWDWGWFRRPIYLL